MALIIYPVPGLVKHRGPHWNHEVYKSAMVNGIRDKNLRPQIARRRCGRSGQFRCHPHREWHGRVKEKSPNANCVQTQSSYVRCRRGSFLVGTRQIAPRNVRCATWKRTLSAGRGGHFRCRFLINTLLGTSHLNFPIHFCNSLFPLE